MRLISTYKDCKQRSSTVSKTATTVSKTLPPLCVRHTLVGVFAPPSMRNRRSQFFGDVNGFPPDSCRLSIHFDRFSVVFNLPQSVSISFNQFQSIIISFNQFDSFENAGNYLWHEISTKIVPQ